MKEVHTLEDLRSWPQEQPPLRLAVLGDPVAHSASPPMHNAALGACGIDARYTRLHLTAEDLAEAFALLRRSDFIGFNCTIPHKFAALSLVDEVDDHARRIGVVNTVSVRAGKLLGSNTDGPGLVRAVRADLGVELGEMRVLILGAGGGAGRAIAMQCAFENCPHITLINRTIEKLEPLANELRQWFPGDRLTLGSFEMETLQRQLAMVDLIINCTSMGMKPEEPSPLSSRLLSPRHRIYDTIYTADRTPLLRAGDLVGARGANGLSMLLHQGALAFEIWFQKAAPLGVMEAALRGQLL